MCRDSASFHGVWSPTKKTWTSQYQSYSQDFEFHAEGVQCVLSSLMVSHHRTFEFYNGKNNQNLTFQQRWQKLEYMWQAELNKGRQSAGNRMFAYSLGVQAWPGEHTETPMQGGERQLQRTLGLSLVWDEQILQHLWRVHAHIKHLLANRQAARHTLKHLKTFG